MYETEYNKMSNKINRTTNNAAADDDDDDAQTYRHTDIQTLKNTDSHSRSTYDKKHSGNINNSSKYSLKFLAFGRFYFCYWDLKNKIKSRKKKK